MLAEVHYGQGRSAVAGTGHPQIAIDMPQLVGEAQIEIWISDLPVSSHRSDGLVFSRNDELLFGCIAAETSESGKAFEKSVFHAYQQIFKLIEDQGFPHLLRVWNYFPGINRITGGLERYRGFCKARSDAFQRQYADYLRRLPSATVVGTHGGGLVIYFIAAREAGKHRENPRQTSAYRYPPDYGPASPSFARATLKRWKGLEVFFISGTASILGHASRHRGDIGGQLDESLRNVQALIENTAQEERTGFRGLSDLSLLKVYSRLPRAADLVRQRLEAAIGRTIPTLYLQGDICRSDLLVEIEGIVQVGDPPIRAVL